jgi:hypothetical protein
MVSKDDLRYAGKWVYTLMQHDASSPSAFTEDRDPRSVPAKQVDILLYPLESQLLVQQAGIGYTLSVNFVRG